MSRQQVQRQGYRKFTFPRFTGGLVGSPRTDKDCLIFDNFELDNDGFANTRQGLQQMHTSAAFGVGQCVGISKDIARADGNPGIIVAKVSGTIYSAPTVTFPIASNEITSCAVPSSDYAIEAAFPVWFEFPTIAGGS